jgi:hypothetical protein
LAGGILTAGDRLPFSEHVGFITLSIGLDFISSREWFIMLYQFNHGLNSYRRENEL